MKNTVFKSVTVLICVVALCISTVTSLGKISDSIVESAKYTPVASGNASVSNVGGASSPSDVTAEPSGDDATPSDDLTADSQEPSADDGSADVDASVPASSSGSSASSTKPSGSSSSSAAKKPSTPAEILNYFNTAANKIKTSAKGGTYNYEKNSQAGTFTLGGPFKMFSSAIDGLVEKNMGEVSEHKNLKMSKADLKKYVPVENESWTSKLTTANISSATLAEKNGNYVVTIKVKADADSTAPAHGAGNHGRAFSIVQVSTILDNAGPVKSLLEGNVKIGYRDGRITATIDPKTGNITHLNYYYVWILDVTVGGTNVNAPFGIESDFTINW